MRLRLRKSWGANLLLASTMAGLVSSGCDQVSEGGYDQPYSVERPAHPAMSAPLSSTGSTQPSGQINPHAGLPSGHPPLPAAGGATGPGAKPPPPPSGPEVEALGIRATAPDGWVREAPLNSMRLAQFKLPHVEGDSHDGELTVIPAMGSVDGNVKRWEGQFEGAPQAVTQEREVSGLKVTYVTIDGTFIHKSRPMAPGPGTPRPDYKLLAAIVQAPEGQLFFKSWGPRRTMERWSASFDEFLNSLRPSE